MIREQKDQIEDLFYKIGKILLLGMLLFAFTACVFPRFWQRFQFTPCIFHLLTGYYCPGCGGTRAISALLHGKFLLSMYYHPLVLYGAVVYLVFMATQAIGRVSRRPEIGMKFHLFYVWVALAILFLNCVVKNILHFSIGFVL